MPLWRRSTPENDAVGENLWLLVGLGNPGRRFEDTRHNVGFMVVERLAERYGFTFRGSRQRADVARGSIEGMPVLLAMPVTYMNDSGIAVSRLMSYYRVPRDRLIVVYDEIDLPFGTLRMRPSGSSAGHRGLESIIREIGSSDFTRLRVGVGRPRGGAIHHVLGPFSAEETNALPGLIGRAADAVVTALTSGVEIAMNRFNGVWLPD